MLKVGLTGGIGSGKTTVASLFADLGIPQIDADIIAHDLVGHGKPALKELTHRFGAKILTHEGTLNRKTLREIVFSDAQKKQQLEALLHPLVYEGIQRQTQQLQNDYVIISIPLLIETNMQVSVDRILVVDCPQQIQIARVAQRDHLTADSIKSIINSQIPREQRLATANDVINNDCSLQQLAQQVKKLHNSYLTLSKL